MKTYFKSKSIILMVIYTFLIGNFVANAQSKFTQTQKPWTYWWWMGSAVNTEDITYHLENFAKAGLGGVHIIPIYGVEGYEKQFIPFLSEKWIAMLEHTIREGKRLNLGVDMTLGTGWNFGGKSISAQETAGKLLLEIDTVYSEKPFLKNYKNRRTNNYTAPLISLRAFSENNPPINLIDKLDSAGNLSCQAPKGRWFIAAMYAGRVMMQVKRPSNGEEGLMMDYLSESALKKYLIPFDTVFAKHKNLPVRAFYNDSYEITQANWTDNFMEEFEKRRGYDIRNYSLRLNLKDTSEIAMQIRCDYNETISDLMLEKFTQNWAKWSHQQGKITRNEAHGSSGNLLDLYAAADIPETESFGSYKLPIPNVRQEVNLPASFGKPDVLIQQFASSAAHVSGKNLVSCETGTWLAEHFQVSLSQIKPEIDQLFTSGVNHIFFHGITYSPKAEGFPGWLFYASTNFGLQSSFWQQMPLLTNYISRCQRFLQAGKSSSEVLLYFPIYDIWSNPKNKNLVQYFTFHTTDEWFYGSNCHQTAQKLRQNGIPFDYVSDKQLSENAVLIRQNYKAIVVPKCQFMPLKTLQALNKLAEQNIKIIFLDELPTHPNGLSSNQIVFDNFKKTVSPKNTKIISTNNLITHLKNEAIFLEGFAEVGLVFQRRKLTNGFGYFIFNSSQNTVNQWITISKKAKIATLCNPLTNKKTLAYLRNNSDKSEVFISLASGESVLLSTLNSAKSTNLLHEKKWQKDGEIPLKNDWKIDFIEGKPVLPKSFKLHNLVSWTVAPDTNARYFSGIARYTTFFDKPLFSTSAYQLDLGKVCESAVIYLNGKKIANLWSYPFTVMIEKSWLKPLHNKLEIEVTNLAANRIIDLDKRKVKWKKFYDINFVNIQYKPFDAANWEPVDSGLLGEVKLILLKSTSFEK